MRISGNLWETHSYLKNVGEDVLIYTVLDLLHDVRISSQLLFPAHTDVKAKNINTKAEGFPLFSTLVNERAQVY